MCPDCGKAFRHKPYAWPRTGASTPARSRTSAPSAQGVQPEVQPGVPPRTPHGRAPLRCPDCDRSFSQKSGTPITHRKSHIRDGAFCCAICGQTFDDEGKLLAHQKKHDCPGWAGAAEAEEGGPGVVDTVPSAAAVDAGGGEVG